MKFFDGSREQMLDHIEPGSVCAELGVKRGFFSQSIVARAKPSKLILIDPWEAQDRKLYTDGANGTQEHHDECYQKMLSRMAQPIADGIVEIRRGYSCDVLATFPDNYFDWIYVDANHSFDTARADLEASHRVVKIDGLITGHDFGDWRWNGHKCGVIPAVTSFLNAHPELELLCLTKPTEAPHKDDASFVVGRRGTEFPPPESD